MNDETRRNIDVATGLDRRAEKSSPDDGQLLAEIRDEAREAAVEAFKREHGVVVGEACGPITCSAVDPEHLETLDPDRLFAVLNLLVRVLTEDGIAMSRRGKRIVLVGERAPYNTMGKGASYDAEKAGLIECLHGEPWFTAGTDGPMVSHGDCAVRLTPRGRSMAVEEVERRVLCAAEEAGVEDEIDQSETVEVYRLMHVLSRDRKQRAKWAPAEGDGV